jgi:beta propeller repeat protein
MTRDPPSAGGAFESPDPGALLLPQAGPVSIRGRLFGDVAAAQLSYGFGRDPEVFHPIPLATAPIAMQGELASWDVEALPDGPYVLRLEVEAGDGERVTEFWPLVLERNPPTRLSSEGPTAARPALAGRIVVWQSARGRAGSDAPPDLDLFARDWVTGEEWRVAGAPGDQHDPLLSGRRLVWHDDRESGYALRSCEVRRGAPCRDRLVASGPDIFPGLDVSGHDVVWTDRTAGREMLRACTFRGARCRPLPVPPSTVRQSDPVLSGTRLLWNAWDGFPPHLFTCSGFGRRDCDAVPAQLSARPWIFAADGDLLAWNQGSVSACRFEPDGRCVEKLLATGARVGNRSIAVSRHRIVWSGAGPGADDDVYLCEYDDLTGSCPVQRLNGSPANQRNPQIDGDRVVWEDDREGPVAVYGLELPSLSPLRDRRVRVGRTLRMRVRGRDPAGGALALSATFADGTPLAARGARFDDLGDGSGALHWRPDAASLGSHVVTFAGRGAGGLVARRSARIEVTPRGAPARR